MRPSHLRNAFNLFMKQLKFNKPENYEETLVGQDAQGRKYFEVKFPEEMDKPNKRFYLAPKKEDPMDAVYDNDLSPEWQSWLRKTRKDPPSTDRK